MSVIATGERGRVRVSARLLRLASEDRLVALMRDGSDAAFEVLFARHHRPLLAFCRHMLGSAEDAEDAVQHTFLAAYRDLLASEKEIRLRPWLYAIARNRCLSVLRTRRTQAVGGPHEEPSTEHLSAAVERRHDLRMLLGDLALLPDDQRAALVLTEIGEVPSDEIALVLDCRREKVKALVFQARSTLIANRASRETPCAEIRSQLANLRGSALRRSTLRRHLQACAGCREFRDEVKAQRRALSLILPVAPTAGLKALILGGGGGPAAGAAAGATLAGGGGAATGSVVTKALVAVALAGGGTAAVETTRDRDRAASPASPPAASPLPATRAERPAPAPAAAPPVAAETHEPSRRRSAARSPAPAEPRGRAAPTRQPKLAKAKERPAKAKAPRAAAPEPARSHGRPAEDPIAGPVKQPKAKQAPDRPAKAPKLRATAPPQAKLAPPAAVVEAKTQGAGAPGVHGAGPPADRPGAPPKDRVQGPPAHANRGAG